MSTLKDRIGEALAESGKTQTELARACGVKAPSVNDWLSGKTRSMKAAPAQRAAAFLGVNMLWLTEGRGTKIPPAPGTNAPASPPAPGIQNEFSGAISSSAPTITYEVVRGVVAGALQALGIRYEDLVADDSTARQRIEAVLGIAADPEKPADKLSDAEVMKRLEKIGGEMIYDGKRVIPRQRNESGRKKKPA